jgi:hypothetical protein
LQYDERVTTNGCRCDIRLLKAVKGVTNGRGYA